MSDDERAVFGDELQQRGDPLGELIALQLAHESMPFDARGRIVESKIQTLLDQHHDALYGALAPHMNRLSRPDLLDPALIVTGWRGGFADAVWIQRRIAGLEIAEVLRAMRELPVMRFVRRVVLGAGDRVAAAPELPSTLRELVVGDRSRALPILQGVLLANTSAIEPLASQLEVLAIQYVTEVGAITGPLRWSWCRRSTTRPHRVFDLDVPELEELVAVGFVLDRAFVERYPRLRRLQLHSTFSPSWFEAFARSTMLARHEQLTISRIGDVELALIADLRDRFEHLQRLDLSSNYFSPAGRAAVAGRLPARLRYR